MTTAVSTPHSLKAVTLVNTVLQRDRWRAPKGLGAGCRDVFARCFPAMATVEVVRRAERQAVVEIEPTAARPASDQPYSSGYVA